MHQRGFFFSKLTTFFPNAWSQKERAGAHFQFTADFLPFLSAFPSFVRTLLLSPVASLNTGNDYLVPRDGADVPPGHLPSHAEG